MLRTDGLYVTDSGRWSTCMLVRDDGTGVRGTVSFGVLRHEAARFLMRENTEFELMTWETAHPPRERSRAQLTWVATEDTAEFKWTMKWTFDGESGADPMADVAAVLDEGRLLQLRLRLAGNKLATPRDSHFYPIEARAFGDDWGLEDDARLVRERIASGKSSREGARLAAALGYQAAAIALGESPVVRRDREQVVSGIATLGAGVVVRSMLSLVWDEQSQVRFNQESFSEDAPKGSALDKAMKAIGKWLTSGKSKDQAKAEELASKLDEYSDEVLQLIAVGQMQGAELEKALHEFLASYITQSEERAFEFMKTTLLPWVLEGRDRYA